jgi:hypothetical protein
VKSLFILGFFALPFATSSWIFRQEGDQMKTPEAKLKYVVRNVSIDKNVSLKQDDIVGIKSGIL